MFFSETKLMHLTTKLKAISTCLHLHPNRWGRFNCKEKIGAFLSRDKKDPLNLNNTNTVQRFHETLQLCMQSVLTGQQQSPCQLYICQQVAGDRDNSQWPGCCDKAEPRCSWCWPGEWHNWFGGGRKHCSHCSVWWHILWLLPSKRNQFWSSVLRACYHWRLWCCLLEGNTCSWRQLFP